MEVIEKRVAKASFEIEKAPQFDHTVINDDLEKAVEDTRTILNDFLAR
jgi:guanylate kinase